MRILLSCAALGCAQARSQQGRWVAWNNIATVSVSHSGALACAVGLLPPPSLPLPLPLPLPLAPSEHLPVLPAACADAASASSQTPSPQPGCEAVACARSRPCLSSPHHRLALQILAMDQRPPCAHVEAARLQWLPHYPHQPRHAGCSRVKQRAPLPVPGPRTEHAAAAGCGEVAGPWTHAERHPGRRYKRMYGRNTQWEPPPQHGQRMRSRVDRPGAGGLCLHR